MSEPIPTDPVVDPDFPPEDPVPPEPEPVEPGPEMPVVGGWLDAAAQAEADAKQYTDEQVPLVAGRMVPRNMDRAPTVEDGTDLIAGTGWNQYDPTTNDLVQMWRWDGAAWQALDMSAQMIPVLDIGSATVGDLTGGRINVTDGPIVAGTPGGARVELTGDGLHAYDATGTETARIQGEGGEFVGGSFRTSDTLPGQVTLSDTAHQGAPGLSIEPDDPAGYDVLPSIGPGPADMSISGGVATDGAMSGANFTATGTSIYHNGPGENGAGAWSAVNSSGVEMRYRTNRTQLTPQSLIRAYAGGAQIVGDGGEGMFSAVQAQSYSAGIYTERPGGSSNLRTNEENAYIDFSAGGVTRGLTVDATGVWVKTGSRSYNLEGTTWTKLTLLNGWQAYTAAGGYFNGLRAQRTPLGIRLDGMVKSGGVGVVAVLPDDMQDVAAKIFTAPADGNISAFLEISTSPAHSNKYCLKYRSGPSAPAFVSVSTDAALL